ncbi:MAG: alpha/beta hydrolase [Phycisphaerae bacterium]|nr:alpha/beta hydrolase [Saprospiraceae bacterium]
MKFCSTPSGTRVAYIYENSAVSENLRASPPLVLLHGFCEDHLVWSPIKSLLKPQLLLVIDLPGFGSSALPAHSDMTAYAEAVLAVLDVENITQCVLVGHSMGGYAALEFGARWPERLAGLGLIHSHPFEDSEERKTARRRGIETLQAGKRDLYVAQLFPNLFAPSFLEQNPDTLNELISNGKKQSPEGIAAALQAMLTRRDHQQTLRGTKCPVLFLLGTLDTLVTPEHGLKAALLPATSDLHLLPNVAHMAMYEYPEETAAILNSFWDFCEST